MLKNTVKDGRIKICILRKERPGREKNCTIRASGKSPGAGQLVEMMLTSTDRRGEIAPF